jgi:trehalose-6-phosphate synthase
LLIANVSIVTERTEILEGVLGANLIGFQTYSYARHFISSCTRVLGLESSPKGVDFKGSPVSVGIFPIGIDVQRVESYRFENILILYNADMNF